MSEFTDRLDRAVSERLMGGLELPEDWSPCCNPKHCEQAKLIPF